MNGSQAAIEKQKAVLLYFEELESDTFIRYDRYLKRLVRPLYNHLHHKQKKTGFGVWFERLVLALRNSGWTVVINDRKLARKNPTYPVGIIGYPEILDTWDLPNPAVLGPALYDHPSLAPNLMRDTRFRKYLLTAGWTYDLFHPAYGDACARWFAGTDLGDWADTANQSKNIDFIIYDKIRWDREALEAGLLNPIVDLLTARGFRTANIRYKFYDHETYQKILRRSRAMVFLCEHETQGMAYQEALASNIPILAWDQGFWVDPQRSRYTDLPVPACSVPYFSAECGETFRGMNDFPVALDRFIARWPNYRPRQYVARELSLAESARLYTESYFSLLPDSRNTVPA